MKWSTVAAIWGAGLSTLLALAKLIPKWPLVFPVATPAGVEGAISLQVTNPAKRTLVIDGSCLPSGARIIEQRPLNTEEEGVRAFQQHLGGPSTFKAYVPAEGTVLLTVSGLAEGEKQLIVL